LPRPAIEAAGRARLPCRLISVATEEFKPLRCGLFRVVGEIDHQIVIEEFIVDGLSAQYFFEFGLGEVEHILCRWWWPRQHFRQHTAIRSSDDRRR